MRDEQCDYMGCTKEATVYTLCEDHASDRWIQMAEEEGFTVIAPHGIPLAHEQIDTGVLR